MTTMGVWDTARAAAAALPPKRKPCKEGAKDKIKKNRNGRHMAIKTFNLKFILILFKVYEVKENDEKNGDV